ncbi:hypothetical protein P7C71_g4474, partial [Lecanoromycetidae sp. Uapishka_2]
MFAIMLLKSWAVIFAFPCTTILLTNSAVSLRILGTLNGVATSVSAVGRAVGPAIAGWTFSMGVSKGYVVLPWWTLAAFALLGAIAPWFLVEMEGFGGNESDSDEEEDEELLNSDDKDHEYNRSAPVDIGGGPLAEHENAANDLGPARLSATTSHSSGTTPFGQPLKRISSPLGQRDCVGPGGSDRLSNGLGQSRSGFGAGGTSYH